MVVVLLSQTTISYECLSVALLTPPLDETKQVVGSKDWLHPFNHPEDGERARAFTPDTMTTEEEEAFPEYSKYVTASIAMGQVMWVAMVTLIHISGPLVYQ